MRASQRACLPHSRIMLHQPSGGAKGQVSDILIHAQEVSKIRDLVNDILVEHTQQEKSVIGNNKNVFFLKKKAALHLTSPRMNTMYKIN